MILQIAASVPFNPSWIAIGLAVLNIAFLLGVMLGQLPALRRQTEDNARGLDALGREVAKLMAVPGTIERLTESIEGAARTRESQVSQLVEIKVMTKAMEGEITRLRDERHNMRGSVARVVAEIDAKLENRLAEIERRLGKDE